MLTKEYIFALFILEGTSLQKNRTHVRVAGIPRAVPHAVAVLPAFPVLCTRRGRVTGITRAVHMPCSCCQKMEIYHNTTPPHLSSLVSDV